jgi:hypothetical protein
MFTGKHAGRGGEKYVVVKVPLARGVWGLIRSMIVFVYSVFTYKSKVVHKAIFDHYRRFMIIFATVLHVCYSIDI